MVPLLVAAGITADPEKGQLAWLAQTGPGMGLEGVTATLVGTGEGPFYTLDSLPSMEQTETSEDGLGIFANVDPGRVEVVYDNPFGDCVYNEGWEGSAPNQVATNIEAGHLTIIIAYCDGPPAGDAGMDDAGADGCGHRRGAVKAVCVQCLALLDIDSTKLEQACVGKSPSTIYASDDLAFPGIGLPKLKSECARCGTTTVPIAVTAAVAVSVSARGAKSE